MKTEVIPIDPVEPDAAAIHKAALVLKSGGLVAFPTETVYGLAACAFNASAVSKIFAAKGRPPTNPLIVHLAWFGGVEWFGDDLLPEVERLAARFWPGPLTLVVPRHSRLPPLVTAGLPTMAVRVPDHAVAHALIQASGPLAAPSANVSQRLSATRAEHVLDALDGKVDIVLDGGICPGGIESTVLDLTSTPRRVLRPGPIKPSELREVIGEVVYSRVEQNDHETPMPSPGTSTRHYAPRATLECYADEREAFRRIEQLAMSGKRASWLSNAQSTTPDMDGLLPNPMPDDAAHYAARLYDALHSADRRNMDYIVANLPPDREDWLAVRDRLRRAATLWRE
jgi:L-threonylcarbamoyladenylate synthase